MDGINQIVNQGYSYSPPPVGEPGWVFYAETLVNHNNIWWRHYKYLARYIQHVSAVLLKGISINPIAVYVPLADVYAQNELGTLLIDGEIEARLGKAIPGVSNLLMDLRRAGYDFDLINDHALQEVAKVEAGKLRAGTGVYSVAIVPDVSLIPPESMTRLADFAQEGGCLIFMARLPEAAPGLKDRELRTKRVREQLERIWGTAPPAADSVHPSGKGQAILTPDRAGVLRHLRTALAPDFEILTAGGARQPTRQQASENVGFLHRKEGEVDFYFLSNISSRPYNLRARFAVGHKSPERWIPETGMIDDSLVFEHVELPEGKFTEVEFSLEPFESCFIVFGLGRNPLLTRTNFPGPLHIEKTRRKVRVQGDAAKAGEYSVMELGGKNHHFTVRDLPDPIPLEGPWRLSLGHKPAIPLDHLQSWTELAAGKDYSGWGIYETTFDIGDLGNALEWVLDLGIVHETAEAVLNEQALGAAWKGSRRLRCTRALKQGPNRLRVEVGNLWIQRMHALPKPDLKPLAETFGVRWPHYGEIEPKEIPPSGLLGPVRLLPLKHFELVLGNL